MEDAVSEVHPEEQPKKRRGRRTKAEIEAAKAAEAAAKETEAAEKEAEQVQEDVEDSTNEVEPERDILEVKQSNDDDPKEQESDVEDTCEDDKSDEDHSVEVEDEPEENAENVAEESCETLPAAQVRTLLVYKHPSENSPAKKRLAAFKAVGTLNGFVSVEYVKPGFGVVTGYVKPEHF